MIYKISHFCLAKALLGFKWDRVFSKSFVVTHNGSFDLLEEVLALKQLSPGVDSRLSVTNFTVTLAFATLFSTKLNLE